MARITQISENVAPVPEGWARRLQQIPSAYGQMVFLAGLRDPDTGIYQDYGSEDFAFPTLHESLKALHEQIFRDWVTLPLQRKMADIELYISGIDRVDRSEIIDAWLRLTPYKNLVPAAIQGPERHRHTTDFEVILGLLRNLHGVRNPDPCAG